MYITPIILLILLCSIACVSLFYLFKTLKQFNEKNGKVQSSKVSIAYILLNVITYSLFLYHVFPIYNPDHIRPILLPCIGIILIPIGTIQLLLWDKLGLISLFLGSCNYYYFLVNTGVLIYPLGIMVIFITAMSLPIVIQFALLFVKKDGVNSWSQLEFGFSFRKLKLLYILFGVMIICITLFKSFSV